MTNPIDSVSDILSKATDTPLVHPDITFTTFTNVLLIDISIMDPRVFYNSVNADTFPVLYSSTSLKSDLIALFQQVSFQRLGIVFIHNRFVDNQSFFENADFFKSLSVSHIDFLACNTLQDPEWVNFYDSLSPIIIGASNDKTGNIKYGGDWVMESTREDIEFVYFTESIEYYRYLLDFGYHFLGIKGDGTIWGTGWNEYGQLGIGTSGTGYQRTTLTQITSNLNGCIPKSISCGNYHTMVLMTNGTIWGTGRNDYGQLGLGTSGDIRTTLTQITSNLNGRKPQSISCGYYHTMVLMTDRSIWGSGYNEQGQLGLGTSGTGDQRTTLTQITSNLNGCKPQSISCGVYYTMVLMTNGTIWGTGRNEDGELGLGTSGNISTLTQITSSLNGCIPKSISCGFYHTMVLMTNGTIWGTGYNEQGVLGLGTSGDIRTTLTQITSNLNGCTPQSISCGGYHTMVLMTNGTIWGTGNNQGGQLGVGTSGVGDKRTTLTQITSNLNGCTPQSISCGAFYTMALMTNGTIWGTGSNQYGQLGVGTSGDLRSIFTTMTTNNSNFSIISGTYDIYPVSLNLNCGVNITGMDNYQHMYDISNDPYKVSIKDKTTYDNAILTPQGLVFYNPTTSLSVSYGIDGITSMTTGYSTNDTITYTGNIESNIVQPIFDTPINLTTGVWLICYSLRLTHPLNFAYSSINIYGYDNANGLSNCYGQITNVSNRTNYAYTGYNGSFVIVAYGTVTSYNIDIRVSYIGGKPAILTTGDYKSIVTRTRIR